MREFAPRLRESSARPWWVVAAVVVLVAGGGVVLGTLANGEPPRGFWTRRGDEERRLYSAPGGLELTGWVFVRPVEGGDGSPLRVGLRRRESRLDQALAAVGVSTRADNVQFYVSGDDGPDIDVTGVLPAWVRWDRDAP